MKMSTNRIEHPDIVERLSDFLDGDLSAMVTDFSKPTKVLNDYAAIIAVVTRGGKTAKPE